MTFCVVQLGRARLPQGGVRCHRALLRQCLAAAGAEIAD